MYNPILADCPLFSGIDDKTLEDFISDTVCEIQIGRAHV